MCRAPRRRSTSGGAARPARGRPAGWRRSAPPPRASRRRGRRPNRSRSGTGRPSDSSSITSPTRNVAVIPRSAAFCRAFAIADGAMSTPTTSSPRAARNRACSPLPQPESSTGDCDEAGLRDADERRLRTADVPRRRGTAIRRIPPCGWSGRRSGRHVVQPNAQSTDMAVCASLTQTCVLSSAGGPRGHSIDHGRPIACGLQEGRAWTTASSPDVQGPIPFGGLDSTIR